MIHAGVYYVYQRSQLAAFLITENTSSSSDVKITAQYLPIFIYKAYEVNNQKQKVFKCRFLLIFGQK